MEIVYLVIMVGAVVAALSLIFLVLRGFGRVRHRLTGPELRNQAFRESQRLFEFVEEREAARPEQDPVVKDHEYPHRRVTLHDEETQEIYFEEHLPRVADLREMFAERRVKNRTLDEHYESVETSADIRTVCTALSEMAERLG